MAVTATQGLSGDGISLTGDAALGKFFDQLTDKLQRKYLRQAMTRGGTVIKSAIRPLVPRSHKTGTYKKWSRKVVAQRSGKVDALRKSLYARPSSKWRSSAAQARKGIIGIAVGHAWPEGAHDHLVEFGAKRRQWWGRPARKADQPRHYFKRGWDNAKSKVNREIQNKVRQCLAKEKAKTGG